MIVCSGHAHRECQRHQPANGGRQLGPTSVATRQQSEGTNPKVLSENMFSMWESFRGVTAAFLLVSAFACSDVPAIPHAVASTQDSACVRCHKPHHTGCVNCHKIQDSWLPTASESDGGVDAEIPIPHQAPRLDDATCLDCHTSSKWDAPVMSHPARIVCVDCHRNAD